MDNNLRRARSLELASVSCVENILGVDRRVHGYQAAFVRGNSLNAYLGVNSWLILIRDYCGDVWYDVRSVLLHDGLIKTVQTFSDAADALIHELPEADFREAFPLVWDVVSRVKIDPRLYRTISGYRPWVFATQLEICRFLKRMTLLRRADVESEAIEGFIATQSYLGSNHPCLTEAGLQILGECRSILGTAINWDELVAQLRKMGPTTRIFTPGASSDGGTDFGKKLVAMSQTNPTFFQPIMGAWLLPITGCDDHKQWLSEEGEDSERNQLYGEFAPVYHDRHAHTVKLSTAPKSMKTPRVIAMEPTNLQTAQRYAKDILYRYTPDGVDLDNQDFNRILAEEGSRNGNYATLDLSSASDYVTKDIVFRIFPEAFVDTILWMVPTHWQHGKERGLLHSFATMGNGLTFWVETLTFWAIAARWAGPGNVRVYGDDIIVPTRVADMVVDDLVTLGFKVNKDKSFITGKFRESCGWEGVDGTPCASTYWPRFSIRGDITEHTCSFLDYSQVDMGVYEDSAMKVISLQHRMASWSTNVSRFIASVVKDALPAMTTSRWGTVSPDLWGPVDLTEPGWADAAEFIDEISPAADGVGDEPVVHKRTLSAIPTGRLPEGAIRDLWYSPHTESKEGDDEVSRLLYDHYRYARFLEFGPRPWHEGDGWLPDNATLPDEDRRRFGNQVVVWSLRRK